MNLLDQTSTGKGISKAKGKSKAAAELTSEKAQGKQKVGDISAHQWRTRSIAHLSLLFLTPTPILPSLYSNSY
jgi:hypothetical protein